MPGIVDFVTWPLVLTGSTVGPDKKHLNYICLFMQRITYRVLKKIDNIMIPFDFFRHSFCYFTLLHLPLPFMEAS